MPSGKGLGVAPGSEPAPPEHIALNGIANGAQTPAHDDKAQVKVALTVDAESFVRVEMKGGILTSLYSFHKVAC